MTNSDNIQRYSSRYLGCMLGENISIKAVLLSSCEKEGIKLAAYFMPKTGHFVFIESHGKDITSFRESPNFAETFNYSVEWFGRQVADVLGFVYAYTINLNLDDLKSGEYKTLENPYGKPILYKGELAQTQGNIDCNGSYITLYEIDGLTKIIINHDKEKTKIIK